MSTSFSAAHVSDATCVGTSGIPGGQRQGQGRHADAQDGWRACVLTGHGALVEGGAPMKRPLELLPDLQRRELAEASRGYQHLVKSHQFGHDPRPSGKPNGPGA